jgi:hypothetical protein
VTAKIDRGKPAPEAQLRTLNDRFDPKHQKLIPHIFGSASSGGDFDVKKTGCPGNLPGGCGVAFEVQQ